MTTTLPFLAVSLFFLTTAVQGARKWKCDSADASAIDSMVANIMTYGRADVRFPETSEELKQYCRREYKMIAQLQDYKLKCLKGTAKQIVGVIAYSMKSAMNGFCSKRAKIKKGQELIASGPCANNLTAEYLQCNNDYTDLMVALWNSTDSKQRLGQMCCGYVAIFNCVEKNARPNPNCSDRNVEAHKQFVRGFFENAVNVICAEYNEHSDRCERFTMVPLELENGTEYRRPESYFGALVHNLANL